MTMDNLRPMEGDELVIVGLDCKPGRIKHLHPDGDSHGHDLVEIHLDLRWVSEATLDDVEPEHFVAIIDPEGAEALVVDLLACLASLETLRHFSSVYGRISGMVMDIFNVATIQEPTEDLPHEPPDTTPNEQTQE